MVESRQRHPQLICIASLPLNPLAATRLICRRLRARFSDAKILVGRWGWKGNEHREQGGGRRAEDGRRQTDSPQSSAFPLPTAFMLAKTPWNREIEIMKTVTYPLEIDEAILDRVETEAKRRDTTAGEVCRDLILRGLMQISQQSASDFDSVIADTWEKIGPAPEIDWGLQVSTMRRSRVESLRSLRSI